MTDAKPAAPKAITDIVGPLTPDERAVICATVDTLPPLTQDQRDRLRMIFRAAPKSA